MASVETKEWGLVSGELLAEMQVTDLHKLQLILSPTHAGGKRTPSILALCLGDKVVIASSEKDMKPSEVSELSRLLFEELAMQCYLKTRALKEEGR